MADRTGDYTIICGYILFLPRAVVRFCRDPILGHQREPNGMARRSLSTRQAVLVVAPIAHPGRLLKRELTVRSLSANRLALAIGVPGRITDILNGRRSISADTAVRLGRYFGNRPQFWMDLRAQHDIAVVERDRGREVARRIQPAPAA
jgi:antitoxin HigA-1